MAKDTGLREEKCLGELPERGLEAHTGYNVLPRKSTNGNRQQDTDSRILGLGKDQVRRQTESRSQLLSLELGT